MVVIYSILLIQLLQLSTQAQEQISSPDGTIQFKIFQNQDWLQHSVNFNDKPVIETSKLGITIEEMDLGKGINIGKKENYQLNIT